MLPPRSVLVVFAGLATLWACAILFWGDAPLALAFDDSFYYFEIAQRFADGQGSSFDGIHQTNGYHPLWMWISSSVFFTGMQGDRAVRVLLCAQIVLVFGGTTIALGGIRWPQQRPAILFTALLLGAWLAIPAILRTQLNGMESAVVVAVHGVLLGLVQHHGMTGSLRWPLAARLSIGSCLALAILARTDGALLTPLLLLAIAPEVLREGASGVKAVLPVFLPPTLMLAMFLLGNQLWFDTPLQVSGTLKRVSPGWSGIAIVTLCGLGALGLLWVGRRGLGDGWPTLSATLANTAWYGGFTLAVIAYYTGLQTFARAWYFAPITLWATLLLGAAASDLAARAMAEKPSSRPLSALAPLAALLATPLLAGAVYTGYRLGHPDTLAVRWADRDAAHWLEANLPPGTRVASWDAGLIGYNTRLPVVNLDGVVNDLDWLVSLRAGTAGDRLEQEEVHWFVNHGVFKEGRCVEVDEALGRLDASLPARTRVVKAWEYEQVGAINGGLPQRHTMATCVLSVEPH